MSPAEVPPGFSTQQMLDRGLHIADTIDEAFRDK
jgi:hypothetical protein